MPAPRATRRTGERPVVAAIIANESISGPGRQLAALAAALRELGVDMRVAILHRTGNPSPPYAEYLRRLAVPCTTIEDSGPLDFGVARRARALLHEWNADVLQTHGYKASAIGFALNFPRRSIPWIGCFHGETHEDRKARFYHWLDHRMLGAADRVIVMSERQRASFHALGSRVRVVHNAVLPHPIASTDDTDAGRIAEAASTAIRPILGVVGRLSPEKGVDIFLDACAILTARGQPFTALIAGDGPEHERLAAQTGRLGLQENIRFLGSVRDMAALYRHLDVLVIPSRSEGLPNVLLEALRADVPVLSTRVGAVPEVLTDPLAGIIVAPGDAAALADALPRVLELRTDPAARKARLTVADALSIERRVHHHLGLYREVSGGASAAAFERGADRAS